MTKIKITIEIDGDFMFEDGDIGYTEITGRKSSMLRDALRNMKPLVIKLPMKKKKKK